MHVDDRHAIAAIRQVGVPIEHFHRNRLAAVILIMPYRGERPVANKTVDI